MEDLHWADTTSLELIESLFYLAQNYRVVYINVFRPGYWQSADRKIESVPKWLPEVDFAEISLNPLDKQMGELLINNILQVKGLRPAIRQQIIDRAGGNPFFIEEVVRSLIEEGAIVRINGAFEVTEKIDHVVIPSTINDVLTARIDRLEEQTRDLIKIASVIGRSFFDRILKDVAESIERVDDRLAYLKDAELIRDRIRMKELEYLFKHALAQEAAYESTLLQQRKQLHRKVAQSIERLFRERIHEFYGMLAHHYSVGEDAEKAEEYLTKAGEEALKSSASSEALNYYKGAMELYIKTYGDTIDSDRMAKYEENIAFALFYRGHHAEAIHYFGKVLSRLGVKDPKNKLSITIKMVIALIILIKDLYLPSLSRKNIPTDLDLHILKIILYRAQSLSSVDAKRFFLSALWAYKRVFKYDLASSQLIFDLASGASVTFSWSGISFSISRKILHHVEQNMRESNYRIFPSFYQVGTKIHNFLSGNWLVELDEKVINHDIQTGATLNAAHYLIWTGFFYLELGDFAATKKIVDWLKHISDEFNDEGTRVIYYHLNTLLLKKLRRLDESIKDADECIDISEQIGQRDRIISLLGSKAQMHLMKSNLSLAKESVDKSMGLISNEDIVSPYYYSSHLMGSFLYNIAKLEEATISNNSQIIAKYRREALSSGKTVVRNSRKVASERTRAFLQMGRYFWVTGRKRQALKWWDRSIKEGERLGARPDLSRTYFEVGKRLSEPQSKYKELVGIDAKGYLEKARILFEEMGLERDLDDLDRLTADHGL
jgi:tetratricopeptide (TPR) repeat protein